MLTRSPSVIVVDDDIAAGAANMPVLRHIEVVRGHLSLNLRGAPDCVDNACELDQCAVGCELHDPAVMLGVLGLDEILAEGRRRAWLPPSSTAINRL